jgi:hypothetical protein
MMTVFRVLGDKEIPEEFTKVVIVCPPLHSAWKTLLKPLSRLALPKFGPEPRSEPRTAEPDQRFWFGLVLVQDRSAVVRFTVCAMSEKSKPV